MRISDWSSDVCSSDLSGGGKTRVTFLAPARGLIGYHGEFLTDTRGTGIMHRLFDSYGPHKGPIQGRRNGVLISNGTGKAVPYALWNLEDSGEIFFIDPGSQVTEGMVIGEQSRGKDIEGKPRQAKQRTHNRPPGKKHAGHPTTHT